MSPIYANNSLSIGRTPLVQLIRVTSGCGARVLAKIEGRNPAYAVKCRIAAAMVAQAERDGLLEGGRELIEPSSGNTGIALAFVAAAKGIPLTLTMPMAQEGRFEGRTIVVVLPDSGERYLSTALFENLFDAQGLPEAARPWGAILTSNPQITKSGTKVRESRLVMCRASPAWSSR